MALRFTTLMDFGDGDKLLIAKKQNNGEFTWYPIIRIVCLEDYSDFPEKWSVTVMAVSPELAKSEIPSALSCIGVEDEINDYYGYFSTPIGQAQALAEYGVFAPIWSSSGNNLRILLRQAHKEAEIACFLTGFVFDRPVNLLGTSGWNALAGNLTAGY